MHDKYFEGILQLRGCKDEDIEKVRDLIESRTEISSEKSVKGGRDFYVVDKRPLRKIMSLLKDEGCEVKISATLHTRDSKANKDLYRVSLLVRIPQIKKGDVVVSEGRLFLVTSVSKKVSGVDLVSGKKVVLKGYDEVLPQVKVVVSKIKPRIEVLHPQTYQSVVIENPKRYEGTERVNVVDFNGLLFVV